MDDLETEQEGALARMMGRANTIAARQPGVNSGGGALSMAAAMLAPTKTGHFSESLSRGLGALGEAQDADAKLRSTYSAAIMKALMPQTMGHSLVDPLTGRVISTDPAYLEGKQMDRDARLLEMRLRARDQEQARIEATAAAADRAQTDRVFREEQARLAREAAEQRAAEQRAFQKELEDSRSADRRYAVDNRPQLQPRAPHPVTIDDPKDPRKKIIVDANNPSNVIGQLSPKGDPLSPTMQKELFETDDLILTGRNALGALKEASKLNPSAYDGFLAGTRAAVTSNLAKVAGQKSPDADATVDYENLVGGQALESLKSIFGAAPTEGERKILLELQASSNKTQAQRRAILERAAKLAERRIKYNNMKAKAIRDGTYTSQGIDINGIWDEQEPPAPVTDVQPTNRGALRNSAPKSNNANMPKGWSWEKQ